MTEEQSKKTRLREIPYNYTSFSDREIVIRFLGEEMWALVQQLRGSRRTGLSARMLFEVLGDMWVITRNPYVQDDLINNPKRRKLLIDALRHRLNQMNARADGNADAIKLFQHTLQAVDDFELGLKKTQKLREKVKQRLRGVTSKHNIDFSGIARVSHSTDATDWRVEMPFVVITPDSETEIADIVKVCIALELTIIPRGGGTGYTGSAVPLYANSAIINTEKLEDLSKVEEIELVGVDEKIATVNCGAGVVTRRVSDLAAAHGLAFAVDLTSQDASTIGGNVAMNAGGKKAVLWGTTLDNLVSWKMVTPTGEWIEIERIHHNLGKIHEQEEVSFRIHQLSSYNVRSEKFELLTIPGNKFRQEGLGKDVTDKFLSGLPGIQKEGCDGFITSARFVLHRMPQNMRTVCLEFFDADIADAVPAIYELKTSIDAQPDVLLTGLEHLDDRYVKAVRYATKSTGRSRPRMVLLIDIASNKAAQVEAALEKIKTIAHQWNAEYFVASSVKARAHFWLDRSRTAAISQHTNAFKINEDVVIPLDRLAEYTRGIERINIEQSIKNKIQICENVTRYITDDLLNDKEHLSDENTSLTEEIIHTKQKAAASHLDTVKNKWQLVLQQLDTPVADLDDDLLTSLQVKIAVNTKDKQDLLIDLLRRREAIISYRVDILDTLRKLFSGQDFESVRFKMDALHKEGRNNRLFIALHMHAGDGNVHTNIPVHSANYDMMQEADAIVDQIMLLADSLDGSISGEHGIGITKIKYLQQEKIDDFSKYKKSVDPQGHFNRGKLQDKDQLDLAYTPSLQLLQQEAILLEASELGALNDEIKHCMRCGKCKPVCMTHIPRANLLYSPRNKILATGLMIEAFLYEEQTRRGVSMSHFEEMNDVVDHCTICHKCLSPCPVNIDFGDVTIRMRKILVDQGKKKTPIGAKAAFLFLNATNPTLIRVLRIAMARWGFKGINLSHYLYKAMGLLGKKDRIPPATTGKPDPKQQIVNLSRVPIRVEVPRLTMRSALNLSDESTVPILRDPNKAQRDSEAVFYFPGCGSERLFSQIGMATLAMLYEQGVQTVLPPGYLCCGYPQKAAGLEDKGKQISTENRVLFHRIANTLNYLDIKTVIVSCGTCMDQLLQYEFESIFPGCRLLDIHEYLMEKNVTVDHETDNQYLFHDPCHTPSKTYNPVKVAESLMDKDVLLSDRCCGESGTLGTARPDIAEQLRYRKLEEIKGGMNQLPETGKNGAVKILTSCPSCQQGLSKYAGETGITTEYIVVELAERLHGKNWEKQFLSSVKNDGIERVLL